MKLIVNANDSFTQSDEDALRQCLQRAASDILARPAAIFTFERSRFDLNTSYDAYLVDVRFEAGDNVRLFLKDFGFSSRAKNDPARRREREVSVYRDLLADAALGTARYYGCVRDDAAGRFWLLLEYVDGTPVGYTELGVGWAPAAEALGRMHGHFAHRLHELRDRDFLIRHDADFFWAAVEQAAADVRQVAPHLLGRVEGLASRYDATVTLMISQPPTLVHGGCRPSNILIGVASDRARACILDWEEAGIGAALFDVAHLLDGIESPLLDRLLAAYRLGAAASGMSLPPLAEMKYQLECFRLHMAFNSMSRIVLKKYREKHIIKLLDYGESAARTVYGSNS